MSTDNENLNSEEIEEVFPLDVSEENDQILEIKETELPENFDEVLQLTQYNDSMLAESKNDFVIAEYIGVKVVELEQKHQAVAKSFVSKITKFVLDFNDVVLSEKHQDYIKQVGQLQLQHLSDLLYLTDVNKQMLNNIIARVNATQAEDYAIIASYNALVNQHLKLIKELQNTYRSIPTVLKKMKADVLCNQELEETVDSEGEVITEAFGDTQYNNQKQLLRGILDKKKNKQNNEKPN